MKIEQGIFNQLLDFQTIKTSDSFSATKANLVFSFGEREIIENCKLYEKLKSIYPNAEIVICSTAGQLLDYKLINDEFQYIGFGSGMCDFYVLALNPKTGISYCLSGFDVNDFLGFLSDFKASYFNDTGKKLKTSKFIKNYKVENLDFECLYKGLKTDGIDREKHPCLIRCSDRIKMH